MRHRLSAGKPPPYHSLYQSFVAGEGGWVKPAHKDPASVAARTVACGGIPLDREFAAELRQWNVDLGAGSVTLSAIDRLASGEAVAVVGGQQPVPFGGLLFSLYKAVSVCLVAEQVSEFTGRPTVPVFWVHSDDHDFEEIRGITVELESGPVRLELPTPSRGTPVGAIGIDDGVRSMARQLHELVGGGISDLLPGQASDLGQWYAKVLLSLLGRHGLVAFDPRLWSARRLAVPILLAAVARDGWPDEVEAAGERLVDAGFRTSLSLDPDHSLVFWHGPKGREAIHWQDDGTAVVRSGELEASRSQLQRLIRERAVDFSPNVALRPFVQDALFPVAVVVAGPGEVSYLAQLKGVADGLERELAPTWPRLSLTIIDPSTARFLAETGLDPVMLESPEAARDLVLNERGLAEISGWFNLLRSRIDDGYREMLPDLVGLDPDLGRIAAENRSRVHSQLEYLFDKARQKHRAQHRDVVRAVDRSTARMLPGGRPQEQVWTVADALAKWNGEFLSWLAAVPIDGQHRWLWLEEE